MNTHSTAHHSTRYYSTNRSTAEVDLAVAMLKGQADDRGLFMPRTIPRFEPNLLQRARKLSYPELAFEILRPYVEGVFSDHELSEICYNAFNFPIICDLVCEQQYILRLDYGPTASFKDFAARFMAQAMAKLLAKRKLLSNTSNELLILTATSGDTGSAVANAFLGVEGIKVVVLFPRQEVSERQRKQMTTLGNNICALALDSKFDTCQALVKQAFADLDLQRLNMSSANSINIGRLLPQSIYYVYAASQLADIAGGEQVIFAVPSGNFGNLMGGMLAIHAGLPVARMVAATNANDAFPRFLATGQYQKVEPSRECISNAMNVGHPSNLVRLVELYGGQMNEKGDIIRAPDLLKMQQEIYSVSISDEETRATITELFRNHQRVVEPHCAVAYAGLKHLLTNENSLAKHPTIILETANPAKFPLEVIAQTGHNPEIPISMANLEQKQEICKTIPADYNSFKEFLLMEYGR